MTETHFKITEAIKKAQNNEFDYNSFRNELNRLKVSIENEVAPLRAAGQSSYIAYIYSVLSEFEVLEPKEIKNLDKEVSIVPEKVIRK